MQLFGILPARRTLTRVVALGLLAVSFVALSTAVFASPRYVGYPTITRVSLSSTGVEGNYSSAAPALSADGRYAAFVGVASNLVPGDTNGLADIFVRDLASGETTRASVSSAGIAANGDSSLPSLSADGRFVAFESWAYNFVPGDAYLPSNIFVRDMASGETTRASVSSAGVEGNGDSGMPLLCADGHLVVFESRASNLVPGDTNGLFDIFVRDMASGETTRASVSSAGVEGNGLSVEPALSADGRFVAFQSFASNLVPGDTNGQPDIFVRDLSSGETTRASASSAGIEGNSGSYEPALSSDGRLVAFHSWASNLVPADANGRADIFVRDLVSGETTRASTSSVSVESNHDSQHAAVSASGRFVAFQSLASNLVAADTNGLADVFVRDLASGETVRASISSAGTQINHESGAPALSADGRFVAFESWSPDLVFDDTNGEQDVFVRGGMQGSTAIAVTSASRTLSTYGQTYALTGRLVSSGIPLAGRPVLLLTAPTPAGPWAYTPVVSATASADGQFRLSHVPRSKTYYRACFEGEPLDYDASTSELRYALPRAFVGRPIAPSTARANTVGTVYGYLKPRHAAGTYPVRIYKYRYLSGAWRSYGYQRARAFHRSTYTRYSATVRLTRPGKWYLRAYHPADTGHGASWSTGRAYVTVR